MTNSTKKPWPRYSGRLKTPLELTADLTVEIPARLAALCALYRIDANDPLWERKLLVTLAHRHVPGLQCTRKRKEQVEDVILVELVDEVRCIHEAATGDRLPAKAAVAQVLFENRSHPWFGNLSQGRAMRIYSGRRELARAEQRAMERTLLALRKIKEAEEALDKAPADSAARLFAEMLSRRW